MHPDRMQAERDQDNPSGEVPYSRETFPLLLHSLLCCFLQLDICTGMIHPCQSETGSSAAIPKA